MLSKELDKRLGKAIDLATKRSHEFVTLEHLLYTLCEAPLLVEIFERFSVSPTDIKTKLEPYLSKQPKIEAQDKEWKPSLTLSVHRVFESAALQMQNSGRREVAETTVLVSLFEEKKSFACFVLEDLGLNQFDVISIVSHDLSSSSSSGADQPKKTNATSSEGETETSGKSALEEFATNLNDYAKSGHKDPLVGRQDIIQKIIQSLARKQKNNPLLIGDSGVGKTAIIEGLAEKIVLGDVPEFLKTKVIYSVDLGSLLAGAKYRGDFEGRLKKMMKEAKERKNVILFFDEIHTLVGAGSTSGGSMDASNLLKPALAKGDLSCIGATTFTEYRQHFEKDRALTRRFQKIDLSAATEAETLEILQGISKQYEKFHSVQIEPEALKACVDLSVKYIANSQLPDKAIDLLDEVCSFVKLESERTNSNQNSESKMTILVNSDHVSQVVSRISGVPSTQMDSNESTALKDLDMKLKSHVFGQDEAIEALVRAIKFARSGLEHKDKPWGSFLFAGPTGVGKTEVCRQLARILGIQFQRFDMSEYMEKHTVARLVGAPPGYVGFDQGGQLTEAVTKNPYSLVLLDEMEKAHPDVYNILLQVMDAGRLTDSQGRLVNFKNCIIVMTTNAGAQDVAKGQIGLQTASAQNAARQSIAADSIKKAFTPEFINRLTKIVYFNSLNLDLVQQVVEKQISELRLQLAAKNIRLEIEADSIRFLAKKSFDPIYGARPVARKIDELVKSQLVDEILFGSLKDGGRVSISGSDVLKFHFEKGTPDRGTSPKTPATDKKTTSKSNKKIKAPVS